MLCGQVVQSYSVYNIFHELNCIINALERYSSKVFNLSDRMELTQFNLTISLEYV